MRVTWTFLESEDQLNWVLPHQLNNFLCLPAHHSLIVDLIDQSEISKYCVNQSKMSKYCINQSEIRNHDVSQSEKSIYLDNLVSRLNSG